MLFYKNKKVLVTGGAGFIGSHIVEALSKLGARVTIFDNLSRKEESLRNLQELETKKIKFKFIKGDILDFPKIKNAVSNSDLVFHLAALPSNRLALSQPREYAQIDILGTVNILEAARQMKTPPKIMFASSNKVYGKNKTPFKESSRPLPEGPYGQAKLDAEEWCRQYAKYYNLPVFVVRYFHVIGPRSQPDLVTSIFVERAINGEDLIVHGNFEGGKFAPCAAAFTNIYDAVRGTLLAMQKTKGFDVLNIGASHETTIFRLAEIIIAKTAAKKKGKIIKKQMLPHEALRHSADPKKSKALLGWEAKTPIAVSVEQYISWRMLTGVRKAAKYKEKI